MDRPGQDTHHLKITYLIPAGFKTSQGTLLHGLFNVRFKAVRSGTQSRYLSLTPSLLTYAVSHAPPLALHVLLYMPAEELLDAKSLPAPAPPTCTDCLKTSGLRLSPTHRLSQPWPNLAVDWEPCPITTWPRSLVDLNPRCPIIQRAWKNDAGYNTHRISLPQLWTTDPYSSLRPLYLSPMFIITFKRLTSSDS